ncbi:uncharacterized protein (DUF1778 family) [Peptoniphilus koenoeneniae]|uniref:Uncharacterized protein (DUF1778 family) n=1 Tax=Peptoniphilus koenoeneniae TaxID=507751 RepID=A0ABU0AVK6_9FIRM|nr:MULTISPECIES: hypothetical protein [Peptoniphilus]ERT56255.1 hypothetical protein HMPREF1253_1407 [Peptoniphilus sp. BV3C26]MDQ0275297.1 uncharacterized protein (DUF1778 family) [Peptoniphilus koenoeneniae]
MKAPKFPNYDEAVNRKKKKPQNLLSKEEWQALEEERKQKERDKGKRFANHRKKDVTIAFRTNRKDRELIFKKIAMSGLSRQDYMTNAILDAPVKIFATRNVIDSCKNELQEILSELKRVEQYGELDASYRHELKMITEIIEVAIQEKSL